MATVYLAENKSMENKTKKKIFIVDDDSFLLSMYSQKFTKKDFEVTTCSSTTEAFKKLKEGYIPDVMILDIIMPGMDGLELLKKIKEEKIAPKSVIVMLTNQGGSPEIETAKTLGVNGYIVKATTIPSEVVEEVEKIMTSVK